MDKTPARAKNRLAMREPEFEGADRRRRARRDPHEVAGRIRLTALLVALLAAQAPAATSDAKRPGRHESCREAVGDSRMICVTGEECQKEISSILAACGASNSPACAAARDEMRRTCSRESPWYGTRKCEAALSQVGRRCGD